MYRGTTPTVLWKIKAENINLSDITNGQMVFNNSGFLLVKPFDTLNIDATNKTISTELSQEETLGFIGGKVEVQLRVLFNTGIAMATPIKVITAERILKGGVIEWVM